MLASPMSPDSDAWRYINAKWQRPIPTRSRYLKLLIIPFLLLILLFWRRHNPDIHITSSFTWKASTANPVTNSTLGFQNIFVLALPERTDRREAITEAANATDFTIEFVDGIKDEDIPPSGQPPDWNSLPGVHHKPGELGCLMSHVKAWRQMIKTNTTSALVLESDVDWDMRIQDTMIGMADAAKTLTDFPILRKTSSTSHARNFSMPFLEPQGIVDPNSPYGSHWDVLWLGHCGASNNGDGRIIRYEDPSAPSDERVHILNEGPSPGHRDEGNGTRIVFQLNKVMCTAGYAISNAGAKKFDRMLRNGTWEGGGVHDDPIDKWMWYRCREDPNLTCLAAWPQIFSPAAVKSTIGHEAADGLKFNETGDSVLAGKGIQISARVNGHLGLGALGEDYWVSEYDTMYPPSEKEDEDEDEDDQEQSEGEHHDHEKRDGNPQGQEQEHQGG